MTVSFHEVQFPVSVSYGASGGPGFNTTVMTLGSGFERRNQNWTLSRATYDVAHGLKTQAELDVLIKFFYARRGQAFGFRYKDWSDYHLPNVGEAIPTLMTTNGGVTTTVQIVKVYGDAGNIYTRTIKKPVQGTVVLYDNGTPTVDFTVDTTTGIITLGTALRATTGRIIGITCQFDIPVRFGTDNLKASIDNYNAFTWGGILLIEVRQ